MNDHKKIALPEGKEAAMKGKSRSEFLLEAGGWLVIFRSYILDKRRFQEYTSIN